MTWKVDFHPAFAEEYKKLSESVQDELLAEVGLLETYGPQLNRPHVDTLNGSKHANMKELRFPLTTVYGEPPLPLIQYAPPLCW